MTTMKNLYKLELRTALEKDISFANSSYKEKLQTIENAYKTYLESQLDEE